jgi:hypothetical protein
MTAPGVHAESGRPPCALHPSCLVGQSRRIARGSARSGDEASPIHAQADLRQIDQLDRSIQEPEAQAGEATTARFCHRVGQLGVKRNLVYRIDAGKVPDAKTMVRLGELLEGPALRSVFERIVQLAVARRVTRGRKLRVDTTVVETPIRYPSDSRLCEDVAQGVCREIERLRSLGVTAPSGFRNVRRSVTRRVREITHVSRRPMGVRCAAVPKPGHRSPSWLKRERQRSFRKARAWRAAGEARIARLKNTFARREPGAKSQGRGIAREPRTRKASPYRVGRSLKDNREIARLHEAPEEAGVVLASAACALWRIGESVRGRGS